MNIAGLGITPLEPPANEAPFVIYGWLATGILVLIYFLITDRSRIARTGLLFDESQIEAQLHEETKAEARSHEGRPG